MNEITRKLEALLFVAGEAIPRQDLTELLGADTQTVEQAVTELVEALDDSGLSVVQTQTHVGLTTNPVVAEFLAAFNTHEQSTLSKASAETLSLIAYRGPLSRYDIDALRGVDSRSMIRQLLHRGVIQQIKDGGSTPKYDISDEFLLHLGIGRREDLPEYDKLSNNERIKELLDSSKK
ncbi:MAG: SMC-Scp complex subunit ScpB [Candidatus Andersenbacteria bacterium]